MGFKILKIFENVQPRLVVQIVSLCFKILKIFENVQPLLKNVTLVKQTSKLKNRENIKLLNYYFEGLKINDELYYLEFDVRSMASGEN